jgi:hypothetical protein
VNKSNLPRILRQLLQNNIVHGCGILERAIIKEQIASPFYTFVYATLVSIISTNW